MTQDPPQPVLLRNSNCPAGGVMGVHLSEQLIITIDGPAGTGKSSAAQQLAKRLGLEFLNTGAMYRAAAALALDAGFDQSQPEAVAKVLQDADLHFDWTTDPPEIHARDTVNNRSLNLTPRLTNIEVERLVSPLAELPEVRRQMVRKQRLIGQQHPRLVTEGRDQGTAVFPDAQVKFFISASPEIRAERRVRQHAQQGKHLDFETVRLSIIDRDHRDATRLVGPLVQPPDAHVIATDGLTLPQVVDQMFSIVMSTIASQLRPST